MVPLVIRVDDLDANASSQFAFIRSPVRIGRSEINDLPLSQGFVSSFHAVVHFDDAGATFVDMGSTNGSWLDGARLEKNIPTPVSEGSDLRIGSLRLSFQRRSLAQQPAPRRATQFALAIGRETPAAPQAEAAPGVPRPTPPPADPRELGETALRLLRAFAQSYLPEGEPLATRATVEAFLARLADVLEAFGRSFVELRNGYVEFGREMAIRTVQGEGPIQRARDGRQILAHLLQGADAGTRVRELQGAFADLMIHQVALLAGVGEGAKAILQRLSPESVTEAALAEGGIARSLAPVRAMRQWEAYVARHHELTEEEDGLQTALFGPEFARAYSAVSGRRVRGDEGGTP